MKHSKNHRNNLDKLGEGSAAYSVTADSEKNFESSAVSSSAGANQQDPTPEARALKAAWWDHDVYGAFVTQGVFCLFMLLVADAWLAREEAFVSGTPGSGSFGSRSLVYEVCLGLLGLAVSLPLLLVLVQKIKQRLRCGAMLASAGLFQVESALVGALVLLSIGTGFQIYVAIGGDSQSTALLNSLLATVIAVAALLFVREKLENSFGNKLGFTLVDHVPHVMLIADDNALLVRQVDLLSVRVGQVYRVGTGQVVPLDGVVLNGVAEVDECRFAGRRGRVRRERGHEVLAGSKVRSGSIDIKVLRSVEQSVACRFAAPFEAVVESILGDRQDAELLISRVVKLMWMAAVFTGFSMYLRASSVVAICQASAGVLLLVLLPIFVQWVPSLRAAVVTKLFKLGCLLRSSAVLDQLEDVTDLSAELPEAVFQPLVNAEDSFWEFQSLELLDERYDDESLRLVLASLLGHSSSASHYSLFQSISGTQPELELYSIDNLEYFDNECVCGQLQGARLVFGTEPFLLQHAVFLQYSELQGAAQDPLNELLGQRRVFFFAVGGEVVARITMKQRPNFRGAEVGQKLTKDLGVRFALLSKADRSRVDRIGEFYGLELSQLLANLSERELRQRLRGDERTAVLPLEPALGSHADHEVAETTDGVVIGNYRSNNTEALDVVILERDYSALVDLFRVCKQGVALRQLLLLGAVGGSFVLFLGLLFQFISLGHVALFSLLMMGFGASIVYVSVRRSALW